jgi:hypothetical protein
MTVPTEILKLTLAVGAIFSRLNAAVICVRFSAGGANAAERLPLCEVVAAEPEGAGFAVSFAAAPAGADLVSADDFISDDDLVSEGFVSDAFTSDLVSVAAAPGRAVSLR